jgi:hypothetical protein
MSDKDAGRVVKDASRRGVVENEEVEPGQVVVGGRSGKLSGRNPPGLAGWRVGRCAGVQVCRCAGVQVCK